MKWVFPALTISLQFLLTTASIAGSEIILNGLYHGRNLLIQNPISPASNTFCIQEIYVNDNIVLESPRISAVEIDLTDFVLYEPVMIRIVHQDDCLPYLLNPEAFVFKREFTFHEVKAGEKMVTWVTSGEDSSGVHFLDKSVDGLWIPVGEVPAQGGLGKSSYRLEVKSDPGPNMYRVRYEATNQTVYSNQAEYLDIPEPLTFFPRSVVNTITLSRPAFFEVFDPEMNQITKGEGTVINLTGLPPGSYILILEGERHRIFKQ